MEFRLLGPVEIRAEGQVLDAGHGRQRAVLAVLLLELGRVVPVEALIDRVWDHEPPASARNVLSGHVTRLKTALAQDPGVSLSRRAGGYLLAADPEQVDVSRFRALVARAAAARDEQAATFLRDALGLWHGSALAGHRRLRRCRACRSAQALRARAAGAADTADAVDRLAPRPSVRVREARVRD